MIQPDLLTNLTPSEMRKRSRWARAQRDVWAAEDEVMRLAENYVSAGMASPLSDLAQAVSRMLAARRRRSEARNP